MKTLTLTIPAKFAGTFRGAVFSEMDAAGESVSDALGFYSGTRPGSDPQRSVGELIGTLSELHEALVGSVKYEPPGGDTDAQPDTEVTVTDYTAAQILREALHQSGGMLSEVLGTAQVARGDAEKEAGLIEVRTWARNEAERHGLELGEGGGG